MTVVKKVVFLVFSVLSGFTLKAYQQPKQDNKPPFDFSKVKAVINDQIATNQVPSVSIAVVYQGNIIWEESFGLAEKEKKTKATIYTPYALASVTKTLTATAILKLEERKLIQLDSPVNNYLRGSKISSPLWDPQAATIKRVMMHMAGLTSYDQYCKDVSCPASQDSIIKRYGIIFWEPGSRFDYSNIGYGILGKMIESVSGKSLSDFFKEEIFDPLGMKNSYVSTDPLTEQHAIGYFGGPGSARVDAKVSNTPAASSGYASVHDLALFAKLHLKDLISAKEKVLSPSSIDYMQHPGQDSSYSYGLAWGIQNNMFGYTGVLAQGGTTDAQAHLQLIPSEDLAVIVLSNTGRTNCGLIINETISSILPEYKKNRAMIANNKPGNNGNSTQPNSLPNFILGEWKGLIRTSKSDVPMIFLIKDSSQAFVTVGSAKDIPVSIAFRNGGLSCRLPGNLDIPEETGPAAYNLNISMFPKTETSLFGCVVTYAIGDGDTPRLPFWVELNKTLINRSAGSIQQ